MPQKIGIIGLPNAGKSTLFEALTQSEVLISPTPFSTLSPNKGISFLKDERVKKLQEIFHSKEKKEAFFEIVDIAGLVRGASKGEGLGNEFLSFVRDCDLLFHVLRAFEKEDVAHPEGKIDPIRDYQIVRTELFLKDIEAVEKRLLKIKKDIKKGKKEALSEKKLLEEFLEDLSKEKIPQKKDPFLPLLSQIPQIVILNQGKSYQKDWESFFEKEKIPFLVLNLKEEYEISKLSLEEKKELGIEEKLHFLLKEAKRHLDLITFFTGNENETRAYLIKKGASVLEGAEKIHTDFKEKFIKAEVVSFEKLKEAGSWKNAQKRGFLKIVGKDYILQEGDVILIKIKK